MTPPVPPPDVRLHEALVDLASHIDWPEPPDVADAVRAALEEESRPSAPGWGPAGGPWSRRALVAVAVVVVVAAAAVAVPGTRSAVADWLGVAGVRVTMGGGAGAPSVGAPLALGEPATLAAAVDAAPFPVLVPTEVRITAPDEVYVGRAGDRRRVSLLYHPRDGLPPASGSPEVGLLLEAFDAPAASGDVVRKVGRAGTSVEPVVVRGVDGLWLEGAPHVLVFSPGADVPPQEPRLAGNTLVWSEDGVTYRLESALPRGAALRVAEGLTRR